MKIKEIEYQKPPQDRINGCLDVFVTLEDDSYYFFEVTTARYLEVLMEEGKFLPPGYPYIIVAELTEEILKATFQEYVDAEEDSYWLKLYHVIATLDIKDVNEILDQKEKEDIEKDAAIDAEIEAEMRAESKNNLNISSDTTVLLQTISFLIFGSLISYCLLKPGLFHLVSNFIH